MNLDASYNVHRHLSGQSNSILPTTEDPTYPSRMRQYQALHESLPWCRQHIIPLIRRTLAPLQHWRNASPRQRMDELRGGNNHGISITFQHPFTSLVFPPLSYLPMQHYEIQISNSNPRTMRFSQYFPSLLNHFHGIHLLATTLIHATSGQAQTTEHNSSSLTTWEQIYRTLNTYPLAVDGKRGDLFAQVFTENVTANYTGTLANVTGLANLRSSLLASVSSLLSQHQLGTTVIDVSEDNGMANSTTYFTATLWSVAPATLGEFTILFGLYADDLVLVDGEGWRISHRDLVFMGPSLGNLTMR